MEAQTIDISRAGFRLVRSGPPENFTGAVRVEMLFDANDPSHASGGAVTFEPGARTAWHSHPRGQILIVTAGIGRVQRWGDPVEEVRTGDVVRIPAGQIALAWRVAEGGDVASGDFGAPGRHRGAVDGNPFRAAIDPSQSSSFSSVPKDFRPPHCRIFARR